MAGGVKVWLAIGADVSTLEPDPAWTDITAEANFVASAQIDRGRQYELDITDTGTASFVVNDVEGILDPNNTTGPNFENIRPLIQVKIDLLDPVTAEYTTIFRGYIEEFDYVWDPSQKVNVLTVSCVDAFEILNAIEMYIDSGVTFGDSPPPKYVGSIFFARADVHDRIAQVLDNGNWPSDLAHIFSGNVNLLEGVYGTGDTVLQVVQECADAEFPGLANVYVDKVGNVTFHGRKAKFDPDDVSADSSWNFQRWKAGDGAAVAASISDTAQIRTLSTNYGLDKIINHAYAAPKTISPIPSIQSGQTVSDATSIGTYGFRSWSAEYLLTAGGLNDSLNANDECALFAQYYVANYKEPRMRVSDLSFRSMRPADARAAALWALIVGVDVSDALELTAAAPGGGNFNLEPFFVEGVHYAIKPLDGKMADVTLSLDLSPQAYFADGSMFTTDT